MFANVCAWARAPYPIGPTYVFAMDVLMGLTQDESASASFGIRRLAAIGAVWRDHLDAVSAQRPRPGDRCRRRGHRSNSLAWLRSCRSRSTAALGGLRDGWPHACLPIAAIHGDQQSP